MEVKRPLFVYDAGPKEASAERERLRAELARLPAGSLLYLSGFLLDELDEALKEAIAERVGRGELELLGGGLYSPYLPLLPKRDMLWQLADMADRLEEAFGYEAEGAYLAGGAFDLTLIEALAEEDYAFALLPKEALPQPAYAALEERGVWLLPYAGGEVAFEPRNPRAPYPAGYLAEGGHPRLLPRRSERAADLFAKMRWVSDKLEEAARPPEAAYERLFRGQWGPAYRGEDEEVFLFAWQELLAAENLCDPRKYGWLELYLEDMDADGFPEAVFESHTLNLYLRPAEGGALFGLDARAADRPLLRRRSLVPRVAPDREGLAEGWHQARFEATRYRDRLHLAGRHAGFALKTTYRPRPKEEAIELEWRISRADGSAFRGLFAVDLWLWGLTPPEPATAEAHRLTLPGLTLELSSPRPFELLPQEGGLLLVFPTEIAAGQSRRHRLLIELKR